MTYTETVIPGVWIIEPKVLKDARGYFMEAFKQAEFEEHIGKIQFVQDNESCSSKGVLRGLHYQLAPYSQSKLVRVIKGRVLDVAVHVLSDEAIFTYKVDNPYTPTHERGIRYDDPTVHVDWSITDPESINLSEKDTKAPSLKDAELNFKY